MAEILWYKMEDNAANTTVVDNANNSLTGTSQANTSAMTTTGKVDDGFDFDGSVDYINVSDNALFRSATTGFTLTAWINPDQDKAQVIAAKTDVSTIGWLLSLTAGGVMSVSLVNASGVQTTASTASVGNGTWKHIAMTYTPRTQSSDSLVYFYVNGALSDVKSGLRKIAEDTSTDFSVGARSAGASKYDGQMDDLRFFNRVLTPNEIEFIYDEGVAGRATPLDGSLTTLANVSADLTTINIATTTGANAGTDNNKVILPIIQGNTLKVVQFQRPTASPA